MTIAFYLAAGIAIMATVLTITRLHAVHALLYLVVSLLAMAVVFFTLGAPFVAALEVIIYAGAIMVLFTFVVMILNLGIPDVNGERHFLRLRILVLPVILAVILLTEVIYAMQTAKASQAAVIAPQQVSATLFGPYIYGVELASLLLLSGLVTAFHLGRRSGRLSGEELP